MASELANRLDGAYYYDDDSYDYDDDDEYDNVPMDLRRSINIGEQYDLHSSRDGAGKMEEKEKQHSAEMTARQEIESVCAQYSGCIPDYDAMYVNVPVYPSSSRSRSKTPAIVLRCSTGESLAFSCVVASEAVKPHVDDILEVLRERRQPSSSIASLIPIVQTFVDIHQEIWEGKLAEEEIRQQLLRSRDFASMLELVEESEDAEDDSSSGEYSSEDSYEVLQGQTPGQHILPAVYHGTSVGGIAKLKDLCVRALGDNLSMYEGFEALPMTLRSRVFRYLIESRSMSSKKLNLLVGEDNIRLDLSGVTRPGDHYLSVLERCPRLVKLRIPLASITDKALVHIEALHRLQELDVSSTKLTQEGLRRITIGCPLLLRVNVSDCALLERGLAPLVQRCAGISQLTADNLPLMKPEEIFRVIGVAPPSLKIFSAQSCFKPKYHGKNTRFRRYFIVPENELNRYDFRFDNVEGSSNLSSLNLNFNWWFSDAAARFIKCTFARLERIECSKTPLTYAGYSHLMSLCRQLRVARFVDQPKWDSSLAKVVAANGRFLTSLIITNIPRCKSEHVEQLLSGCPNLASLELMDLPKVDYWQVQNFLPKCKKLTRVDVGMLKPMAFAPEHGHRADVALAHNTVSSLRVNMMETLDDEMALYMLPAFPQLKEFFLHGKTQVSGGTIKHLLLTCANLQVLGIGAESKVGFPLSVIFDQPIKSPLSEISLSNYTLDNLFSPQTLDDILGGDKMPQASISTLKVIRERKEISQQPNYPLILQAVFFFMPQLKTLDFTHQFCSSRSTAKVVELPTNETLETVITCGHDKVRLLNLPVSGRSLETSCKMWKEEYRRRVYFKNLDDSSSSDEDFEIAALFQ